MLGGSVVARVFLVIASCSVLLLGCLGCGCMNVLCMVARVLCMVGRVFYCC